MDGPQRALKRGARYDQATATNAAAAAVLRWLSVLLLLLLCYGVLLEKGKSRERHYFIHLLRSKT